MKPTALSLRVQLCILNHQWRKNTRLFFDKQVNENDWKKKYHAGDTDTHN